VDHDLDLTVAGDVGERVGHGVVGLPHPVEAVAVGVALHEEDALGAQLELVVLVAVLVLGVPRPLDHAGPFASSTNVVPTSPVYRERSCRVERV
jgi:hypothetical protein